MDAGKFTCSNVDSSLKSNNQSIDEDNFIQQLSLL